MQTTFLHTADWQLGKPFAGVDDPSKRTLLQQERISVLKRIAEAAHEGGAKFIVVSGDLFDSPSATKATVSAGCAAIGAMNLPVYAIPGNHDHGGPGSLWEQAFFQHERECLAPNLTLLLEPKPVELDHAVLFPCPLHRRSEASDTTSWLRELDREDVGEKPRIVIAHGSVQGFSSEDGEETDSWASNRIDLARLRPEHFDYVALGDWHGMKQISDRAWYSGTPELDRFPRGDANLPGYVLLVTAEPEVLPKVREVRTAGMGWHTLPFEFGTDGDLALLEAKIERTIGARAQQDLLRLNLRGSLGMEATTRLEQKLDAWRSRLLRLKLDNRTVVAPTPEEIVALTENGADPLINRVASKLLRVADGDSNEALGARLALRELHAACRAAQLI